MKTLLSIIAIFQLTLLLSVQAKQVTTYTQQFGPLSIELPFKLQQDSAKSEAIRKQYSQYLAACYVYVSSETDEPYISIIQRELQPGTPFNQEAATKAHMVEMGDRMDQVTQGPSIRPFEINGANAYQGIITGSTDGNQVAVNVNSIQDGQYVWLIEVLFPNAQEQGLDKAQAILDTIRINSKIKQIKQMDTSNSNVNSNSLYSFGQLNIKLPFALNPAPDIVKASQKNLGKALLDCSAYQSNTDVTPYIQFLEYTIQEGTPLNLDDEMKGTIAFLFSSMNHKDYHPQIIEKTIDGVTGRQATFTGQMQGEPIAINLLVAQEGQTIRRIIIISNNAKAQGLAETNLIADSVTFGGKESRAANAPQTVQPIGEQATNTSQPSAEPKKALEGSAAVTSTPTIATPPTVTLEPTWRQLEPVKSVQSTPTKKSPEVTASQIPIAGLLTGGNIEEVLQSKALKGQQLQVYLPSNSIFETTKIFEGKDDQILEHIKGLPIPDKKSGFFRYVVRLQNPTATLFGLPMESIRIIIAWDFDINQYTVVEVFAFLNVNKIKAEEVDPKLRQMISAELGEPNTLNGAWSDSMGYLSLTNTTASFGKDPEVALFFIGTEKMAKIKENYKNYLQNTDTRMSAPTKGLFDN